MAHGVTIVGERLNASVVREVLLLRGLPHHR